MDSPWEEDPSVDTVRDAEWTRISYEFTNAGYRDGITAGKESALQAGFDDGFARVGAPLGRELGKLRGMASAILAFLSTSAIGQELLDEARDIASQLGRIRFSDITPPDMEAEAHAREHLGSEDDGLDINAGLEEKCRMEEVGDIPTGLTAGTSGVQETKTRPTMNDVQLRLAALCSQLSLDHPAWKSPMIYPTLNELGI